MNRLLVAGSGVLLLLSHAAIAGPAALQVAQADTGAPTGSAPAGSNAAGVPPAGAAQGPSAQPGSAGSTVTGLPPIGGAATPAPAQQATAPQRSDLTPAPYTGTQRNNPITAPQSIQPGLGALPYGGTQATVGVPNPVPVQPYGGTQRDSVGSTLGDLQAHGGIPTYTGTQSTLGAPQNLGNVGQPNGTVNTQTYGNQPYGAQPYGVPTTGGSQGRNGSQITGLPPGASPSYTGNAQGNGTVYSRAPLGSAPVTRDQTGVFGGVGSYDARGVYTGVSPQPVPYGQVYATTRGVAGGVVGTGVDATGPLRPFVPPISGPGRPNSGYGVPNGSKPTYMDARGIQRGY